MAFPSKRLAGCGASPTEVEQLQAEHDSSSTAAQETLLTHLESIVDQDLREWLADLRKIGHFAEQKAEAIVEEIVQDAEGGHEEPTGEKQPSKEPEKPKRP